MQSKRELKCVGTLELWTVTTILAMIHGKTWPMWQIYSSSAEVCHLCLANAFFFTIFSSAFLTFQLRTKPAGLHLRWNSRSREHDLHEPNTVCWSCVWAPAPLECSYLSCFCLDLAENLPPPSRWIKVDDGQLVHTSHIMWALKYSLFSGDELLRRIKRPVLHSCSICLI